MLFSSESGGCLCGTVTTVAVFPKIGQRALSERRPNKVLIAINDEVTHNTTGFRRHMMPL